MRRAILFGAAFLAACSEAPPVADTAPTFHEDVEPILQQSCQPCHAPGRGAPFDLVSYADAKPLAASIAKETQARRMPPWGALATDECSPPLPFVGDSHLSAEAIATLAAWSAAGAPEGDPAAAPAPFEPPAQHLSRVDLTLAPSAPYSPGEHEQYRCFVMDPGLDHDVFVDGYEISPGNPAVVHHAVVYLDPDGASAALADETGSYPCFGGPHFQNTSLLAAWAPGMEPLEIADDLGILMQAHSLVVMQVHYHPTGPGAAPDTTRVDLRLHAKKPALRLDNVLIGNADGAWPGGDGLLPGPNDRDGSVEFRIPADAAGHVERMRFTLKFPIPSVSVYGAGTHMHRAGVDMKIDRVGPAAPDAAEERECLVQTPQWDFDWQRLYRYDAPLDGLPEISSGDAIELRCTYDNTMANPALRAQLLEQGKPGPIDVLLGESTLDEMCVGFLPLVYPNL
jgi:hypothetical protein